MAHGEPVLYSLYVYAPTKGVSIFFTVAYAISAVVHIWQCYRYKSFGLIGLHPVCAVLFTTGYALREYGTYNYLYSMTTKMPLMVFIFSQIFVYICPPLLELSNYRVLSRTLSYMPYCSPVSPSKVTIVFGGLIAIVEILNGLGVALSSNPSSSPEKQLLGSHLTVAAVGIQVAVILIFFCLAALFHRRYMQAESRPKNVQTLLITLYMSMFLIFARSLYRLVEHTGNTKVDLDDLDALKQLSPLLRFEAFFFVFEASLMLINSVLWNAWNPGRLLPRDYHIHLARDGTEVLSEKVKDDRPVFAKIANVVTFGVLFRKSMPKSFQQLPEGRTDSQTESVELRTQTQAT